MNYDCFVSFLSILTLQAKHFGQVRYVFVYFC